MARTVLLALVLVLCTGVAYAQTCDIVGEWSGVGEGPAGSNLDGIDAEIDYDFQDDGSFTMAVIMSSDNADRCTYTANYDGMYTISATDVLNMTMANCELSDCSSACGDFCDAYSDCVDGYNDALSLEFASDCDSFTEDGYQIEFYKETTNWLPWVLGGLAVVAVVVAVVAAAAGFLVWKKRQAAAGADMVFEDV